MKQIFCLSILIFAFIKGNSQYDKVFQDTGVGEKWIRISSLPLISNNGKYAFYQTNSNSDDKGQSFIRDINKNSSRFINCSYGAKKSFSEDSKCFAWKNSNNDTVSVLYIERDSVVKYPKTSALDFQREKKTWAFLYQKSTGILKVCNFSTGEQHLYENVKSYYFNNNQSIFVINKRDSTGETIYKISYRDFQSIKIWSSLYQSVSGFTISPNGENIAFIANENRIVKAIVCFFDDGQRKETIIDDSTFGSKFKQQILPNTLEFSSNNKWLFFKAASKQEKKETIPKYVNVNIWSYRDLDIQPNQQNNAKDIKSTTYVVQILTDEIRRLENNDERLEFSPSQITGNFVLLKDNATIGTTYWWKWAAQPSYYLVSLIDGKRFKLSSKFPKANLRFFYLSPSGKYLVFWRSGKEGSNWVCFDMLNKSETNITPPKNADFYYKEPMFIDLENYPAGDFEVKLGWFPDESRVVLYDNYDIWLIDPSNKNLPINTTNSWGKRNNTSFRIVGLNNNNVIVDPHKWILTAFDNGTKYNGFYSLDLISDNKLLKMFVGPYAFHFYTAANLEQFNYTEPVKARDSNVWLIKRQSFDEYPNLFVTKDFIRFDSVTNFSPQSGMNWLKAELINYKQLDGSDCQGILYKPVDFDPNKKYPVIFNYYEKKTHQLYMFPSLYAGGHELNVPWFVRQGYIICMLDMHTESATSRNITSVMATKNSVMGAVKFLARLKYINLKKMGLYGHSFGGKQTYYLITHTQNVFAAASSNAATSDEISSYLGLVPDNGAVESVSKQWQHEKGQGKLNSTLWERPDLYFENSSVLSAHKTTTPLLITHNPKDNNVSMRQGIEMYLALRRLGKPCWLLEYPDSDHGESGPDILDNTIRLTQFFGYYLKDEPAPYWMVEGIPFKLKGTITGLEKSKSGKKP